MTLLHVIETYLARTGTSPSRLGREALGDPGLVRGLRRGRQLRATTRARLLAFLQQNDPAA